MSRGNDKTICIFTTFFSPSFGGVEKFTENLSRSLQSEKGVKVIVVTCSLDGLDAGRSSHSGIEVIRLPSRLLLNGRFAIPRKNRQTAELLEYLKGQRARHVLVNQRFYPLSLLGIDFAKQEGIPAVVMEHGSAHLTISNRLLDIPIRLYEHAITTRIKARGPRYCAVSNKSLEWLRHFGIDASGVVHNAVDAKAFARLSSGREFFKNDGDDNALAVVFTGRLVAEKGISKLCSAIDELNEEGYGSIHLFVAGDGALRGELEQMRNRNIHYLGRLDQGDVSSLLQQGDVFCLPTVSEGFSTSMLEAAASNMGIIVTDTGGAQELMPSDEYGVILRDSGVSDIKEAILEFHNDRDYLRSASAKVRARVETMFGWSNSADELLDIFSRE